MAYDNHFCLQWLHRYYINLCDAKWLRAIEFGSVYFLTVFAYILCAKNVVGQAVLEKPLKPLMSFNIVRI